MKPLAGKIAVITGGASGIGAAAARLFVSEGASVVICGRRAEEGEAFAAGLGDKCSFVAADIRREEDIDRLIAKTTARHGRIDCLINNAGNPDRMVSIAETSSADVDSILATHVRGTMLGMKHVAPIMIQQRSGSIINIASLAGTRTGFSSHAYSAAKAAIIHLSRCVAVELGMHRVRVNSLSPGPTLTAIFGRAAGHSSETAESTIARLEGRFADLQPIPRAGRPEDIAAAAAFLASDSSAFVSGHDLVVDGANVGGVPWQAALERRAEAARLTAP